MMEPLACQFVNLVRYQLDAEGPNVDSKSQRGFSGEEIWQNAKARYPQTASLNRPGLNRPGEILEEVDRRPK